MKALNCSINCNTSNVSEYVDCNLQAIVRESSYFKETTTDFLQKISAVEFVTDNFYKSLYTSIPNAEGIKAVKNFLGNPQSQQW